MVGVDPEIGTLALRMWVAAGSAVLLVAFCVMLPLTRTAEAARAVLVVVGAVLGAAMTWGFLGAGSSDRSPERRALEVRAQELTVRALAPGSTLACLDALAGEKLETACEKAIFASPATVATATSYVAARLALLSDIVAYSRRGGAGIDALPLRRSLEADRFGFLAYVLAMRDGCTSENCKALALLQDPSRVRANLNGGTLDQYLERYLPVWAKSPDGSVADATPVQPNATAQLNPQGPRKVTVNIDFPTSASIPPVNIMNPEPTGPVLPGVAAAAAANPNPQPAAPSSLSSSHRSRKQAASPPAQAAVQAAASGSAAPVEPVWPEPVPPPPQSAAAPAGAALVQVNPFPSSPRDLDEQQINNLIVDLAQRPRPGTN